METGWPEILIEISRRLSRQKKVLLQLLSHILKIFVVWTTYVRVCFILNSLSTIPCYFLMYAQLVSHVVVEVFSFIFSLYTQECYMYSLLSIGIYSCRYYKYREILIELIVVSVTQGSNTVTNFIQLISLQPVDQFSQTKLRWKAPNEGYLHICGMYKSNNERLRYQAISSCKSFVC